MTQSASTDAVERRRAHLKTLRDEIRVKLHLAGMDAKDQWRKLEPEIEHALTKFENATEHAFNQVIQKIEQFSATLN